MKYVAFESPFISDNIKQMQQEMETTVRFQKSFLSFI